MDRKGSNRGAGIRLRTLGAAVVEQEVGGQWEQVLGPSKTFALMVYLSACPRRTARREELVELLWSDRDAPRARNSLRQLAWALRQRLGDEIIDGDDDVLTLAPLIRTDRDDFLGAVASGDVHAVANAYAGSFLPDLALPGGLDFEQWADGERVRLRAAFLRAGEAVVRAALGEGRVGEAVHVARRVRDEDPSREAGWRTLLESLAAAGEWLTITIERQALNTMLAETARDPEPATEALLSRLADSATPTQTRESSTLVADLAGREKEFAALLSIWASVKAGHAAHVHMTGVAGIGKTRLLQELQQRLRAQGGRVVMLRANPGEQGLPWSLAGELVARLGTRAGAMAVPPAVVGDLVELAPALSRTFTAVRRHQQAGDDNRRRSVAMYELLLAVADDEPMSLLIDDMHWADPESVACIGSMLHRLDRQRILVVTAGRPDLRPPPETRTTKRIVLAPLAVNDVYEIAASIARLPDEDWAHGLPALLHTASGGSPLGVLAALSHTVGVGCLRIQDGAWTCTRAGDLEAEVERGAGVGSRLRVMEQSRRDLLELLATAGWAVTESTLILATGSTSKEVRDHLDALDHDGLVKVTVSGWEVAHDRIRDALLEMIGERGTRCHARLGRAQLEEAITLHDLRRASSHLLAADDAEGAAAAAQRYIRARRDAGDYRPSAGIVAEMLGVERAHPFLERVLRQLPLGTRLPTRRFRLLAVAAGAMLTLGATAMMVQPPSLVLVAQPIAGNPLTPEPVIELRDRLGRPVADSNKNATVQVVSGPGAFVGRTQFPVVGGRVVFHGLELPAHGKYIVRFSVPGYRSVVADTFRVGRDPSLKIVSGTLNGTKLAGGRPSIRVEPSGWIHGNIDMQYSSPWIAASVFLCGTSSWGDPATSWWNIFPLTTPAADTRRVVPVNVQVPPTPGTYHLLFTVYADRSCEFVASGTNWTHERPVWGDGNDLASLPAATVSDAARSGTLKIMMLRDNEVVGDGVLLPAWMGAAVVDVVVPPR